MHPVLFEIGPVTVYTWGVTFVVAILAGTWYLVRSAGRDGVENAGALWDVAIYVAVGALIGARLLYVLLDLPFYLQNPGLIARVDLGGLSFHGGVIGGVAAGYLFARARRFPTLRLLDFGAPATALGYAIVRLGCFENGCCYGLPTGLPWGMVFFDVPRHPTQLYSLAGSVAIFFALGFVARRKPFDGYVWLQYMGMYSVMRFVVEIWRDSVRLAPWLTVAQAASVPVAVASFGLAIYLARRALSKGAPAGTGEGAA